MSLRSAVRARRQAVDNQAVKRIAGRAERPAEVGLAVRAQGNPPAVAAEPGVLRRFSADGCATGSVAEAADVKHEAVGIGTGVFMTALYTDAFLLPSDCIMTGGAKQAFFLFRLFIGPGLGLLFPLEFGSRIEKQPDRQGEPQYAFPSKGYLNRY